MNANVDGHDNTSLPQDAGLICGLTPSTHSKHNTRLPVATFLAEGDAMRGVLSMSELAHEEPQLLALARVCMAQHHTHEPHARQRLQACARIWPPHGQP